MHRYLLWLLLVVMLGGCAAYTATSGKVVLKDDTKTPSQFIVAGLTDQWQKFSIPFDKFRRVKNWASLSEFVVVFDDINSNPKKGTRFVDHVSFSVE